MPNTHRRRRRDETVESRRVGGVNTPVGSRDPVYNFLTTDKWRHNYVIVEKIVKIHEYYTTQQIRMFTNMHRHMLRHATYSIGCRIVNFVTAIGCVHMAESVGSRRELVANSCTHRRRDATKQFRRVGVGGVYWASLVNSKQLIKLCAQTNSAHYPQRDGGKWI